LTLPISGLDRSRQTKWWLADTWALQHDDVQWIDLQVPCQSTPAEIHIAKETRRSSLHRLHPTLSRTQDVNEKRGDLGKLPVEHKQDNGN